MRPPIVQNLAAPFDSDTKRFYLPATIKADCPECGKTVEQDFSQDYLSYPRLNEAFQHGLYCEPCDQEFDVKLIVKVILEVAP